MRVQEVTTNPPPSAVKESSESWSRTSKQTLHAHPARATRPGGQRGPPAPRSRPGSGPLPHRALGQSGHGRGELGASPRPRPPPRGGLGSQGRESRLRCAALRSHPTRALGVPPEEPRPGPRPSWPRPSRPRRESCCSTLRNAEPQRRREEAAGDYDDSRRGPRRGGARRTSPEHKQRPRPGKRRRPRLPRTRSLEETGRWILEILNFPGGGGGEGVGTNTERKSAF
ncbi:translation initiation factor IF-2-like [Herpailurus yagouaroundi]|uniref:translation initiation factor IF-2-like n=1 Tax=Herpailurus yagouaroundi TaxID=1608482 RepID=UPI001AD6E726|nr:translation initiation factor IF-2-like [Puma yagouaroundi]